jgi:flagellar motor switch protein FliN/FliY
MAEQPPEKSEKKTETAADAAPAAAPVAAAAPEVAAAPTPAAAAPEAGVDTAAEALKEAEAAALESVDAATAATAQVPADAAASGDATADAAAAAAASAEAAATAADVDELLKQASFDDPAAAAPSPAADAEPFNLPSFQQVMQDAQVSSIDLLRDVELNVKIELGRNRMLVEDVLKLAEGSVVELDKLAGDPVDVFVNDRLVARGEVLVLNDNFCVRVNEIVAGTREEGL